MTDAKISKIYYDPEEGFLSESKLYKKLIDKNINVTHAYLKKWLSKQETAQLTKHTKKPTQYNSIIASDGPRGNYQMDIIVYNRYAYHGYEYILCVVDVDSRYAQCRAMTNRQLSTIIENLKNIFDTMGKCKRLNADNEFNKTEFNELMDTLNIETFYSQPYEKNKNAIVERFNRTISEKIQLWRLATKRYDWYNVLNNLVKNYNNTEHSTTKNTPAKIFNGTADNEQETHYEKNDFKIGDRVRIETDKNIFSKGDRQKFSTNIYTISRTDGNKIYIQDSNGEELNKFFKPYEVLLITETEKHEPDTEIMNVEPFNYIENLKNKRQERTEKKTKHELNFNILNFGPMQASRASRLPRRFGI